MTLIIQFPDFTDQKVDNPLAIPEIGDSVHNFEDANHYYIVKKRDFFYYSGDSLHIIIRTEKI